MTRCLFLLASMLVLAGCDLTLHEPVRERAVGGVLDLRGRDFAANGSVIPENWLWQGPDGWVSGPAPDRGGILEPRGSLLRARAEVRIVVDPGRGYALQIGAFPGAFRVSVNGVTVWESGVVDTDRARYREGGEGVVLTVQPNDGLLAIAAEFVTGDPLVSHPELNRVWLLGPSATLLADDRAERNWRSIQASVLTLGILVFLWLASLRPYRRSLIAFAWFLGACLAKQLFSVEQPSPLLSPVLPGLPISVYLLLNHGLNLVPIPLLGWFLSMQFPKEVSPRAALLLTAVTAVVTVWELLPFVLLSLGWPAGYRVVLESFWSPLLNLFVVLATLYLFERVYQAFRRRRPLSSSLFVGSLLLAVVVFLPILLSAFYPVKFIYFLGWGTFGFLLVLGFDLARLQVKLSEAEVSDLTEQLQRVRSLQRYVDAEWPSRLGAPSVEDLRPGEAAEAQGVVVQISCAGRDDWLALTAGAVAARRALLVEWKDGRATWVLHAWSEAGVAFVLEVLRLISGPTSSPVAVAIACPVVYRLIDAGSRWVPEVQGIPWTVLEALGERAVRLGVTVLLHPSLKDGLAIGGWRRHRAVTGEGAIELYEAEDETSAVLKDQSAAEFDQALRRAAEGDYTEACRLLFGVVKKNPFDVAARSLLVEWDPRTPA